MSFLQAISSAFTQYVGFHGRARRSEYWWFVLFTLLVGLVAGTLDSLLGLADDAGNGPIGGVATLAVLLPSLAVSVRRLHDTSRSGWWLLLGLIPLIGAIVLLIWFVQDSSPGANQHGPNPQQLDPGYGYGYGAPQPGYGTPGYGFDPGAPGAYGTPPPAPGAPDPRLGTPPQG